MAELATLEANKSDFTNISSAEDVVADTSLEYDEALTLFDLLQFRAETNDLGDVLIEISDWLAHVVDNPKGSQWIVAGEVRDHSEKAYKVFDAYTVNEDTLEEYANKMEELPQTALDTIDESDTDYIRKVGATFVPKSQVNAICTVDI